MRINIRIPMFLLLPYSFKKILFSVTSRNYLWKFSPHGMFNIQKKEFGNLTEQNRFWPTFLSLTCIKTILLRKQLRQLDQSFLRKMLKCALLYISKELSLHFVTLVTLLAAAGCVTNVTECRLSSFTYVLLRNWEKLSEKIMMRKIILNFSILSLLCFAYASLD